MAGLFTQDAIPYLVVKLSLTILSRNIVPYAVNVLWNTPEDCAQLHSALKASLMVLVEEQQMASAKWTETEIVDGNLSMTGLKR